MDEYKLTTGLGDLHIMYTLERGLPMVDIHLTGSHSETILEAKKSSYWKKGRQIGDNYYANVHISEDKVNMIRDVITSADEIPAQIKPSLEAALDHAITVLENRAQQHEIV